MSKSIKVGAIALVLGLFVAGFTLFGKTEKQSEGTVQTVTPTTANVDKNLITKDLPVTHVDAAAGQVILLNTQINPESVDIVISKLEEAKNSQRQVYLVITSPGGSVFAGNKLIAYMETSKLEINTVCSQVCASMAFHIFEAGKIRYMEGRSLLMGHPAAGGAEGTVPEMLSMLTAIKLMTDRLDAKIAQRAGIPYHKFELMVLKNLWIETPDAIKMGLADKMIHLSYDRDSRMVIDMAEELRKRGIPVKTTSKELNTLYEIY